jgi:hypothetical protein
MTNLLWWDSRQCLFTVTEGERFFLVHVTWQREGKWLASIQQPLITGWSSVHETFSGVTALGACQKAIAYAHKYL